MRVVHISWSDCRGGAAKAMARLHDGLRAAGVRSRCLVAHKAGTDSDGVERRWAGPDRAWGLDVIEEYCVRRRRTEASNTLFSVGVSGEEVWLDAEVAAADVVHLHWTGSYVSVPGLAALAGLGKPVVWTLHDQWAFTGGCHYSAGCAGYEGTCGGCPQLKDEDGWDLARRVLDDKATLWPAGFPDAVVAPSAWMGRCARASRLFRDRRVEVIANGLDRTVFSEGDRGAARRALGLGEETLALLFLCHATDERRKGFAVWEAALRRCLEEGAFAEAAERGEVAMVYVGPPTAAVQGLGVRVVACGEVAEDAVVAERIRAADAFVLPSLEDNLPNTAVEALACGTPVVGFRVGGVPELVEDGVNGWLVETVGAEGLAEVVLRMTRERSTVAGMRGAARQTSERFSIERMAARHAALYEELAARAGRVPGRPVRMRAYPEGGAGREWMDGVLAAALQRVGPCVGAVMPGMVGVALHGAVTTRADEFRASERERISHMEEKVAVKRERAVLKERVQELKEAVSGLREQVRGWEERWERMGRHPVGRLMGWGGRGRVVRVSFRSWERRMAAAGRALWRGGRWVTKRWESGRKTLERRIVKEAGMGLATLRQYEGRPVRKERFPRARSGEREWPSMDVVTPSYQQATYLEETLASVAGQDYPGLRHWVMDGGSTDGSRAILERWSDRLAGWVSEKDGGQADAICKGFACGAGEVMAWLNSDDVLMPGALRYVGDFFARHKEVDVVYGHRVIIDEAGREIGRWVLPRHRPDRLRWVDWVPQETLFWRRRLYEKVGGLDRTFHFALDWDLLLRMSEAGARMVRVPYFLGCFRVHEAQKTSARMEELGRAEMDALRRRTLGRVPTAKEMYRNALHRGMLESVWARQLLRLGIRW